MFFHVAGGGIWTALDLFLGMVIGPILSRLSIPARMEFSARFMPKMLLAYAVMYGILEFTFVYDRVSAATLAVLTLMLVVIAIDVPLLFGFTVARYAGTSEDRLPEVLVSQGDAKMPNAASRPDSRAADRRRESVVRRLTGGTVAGG